MIDATITVDGLRKHFGTTVALDAMTFAVRHGQVTGFVGPNGAGKSTTMRVIAGLDRADAGTALIGGKPWRALHRPLRHVGVLLDAGALQPGRTARDHLLWLAHSQGLTARRVDETLDQAGLSTVARRRAGGFSLGMRQRLGIAAAMLGDPAALMLDEPFNGMDPEGIIWMRGFLKSLAAQGRAVLVSSHLMGELQDTADHLIVAGRGRVIADAPVTTLLAAAAKGRITVRPAPPTHTFAQGTPTSSGPADSAAFGHDGFAHARHAGSGQEGLASGEFGPGGSGHAGAVLRDAGGQVHDETDGTLTVTGLTGQEVIAALTAHGVAFTEVAAHRATLEQAYLDLTRDAVDYRAGQVGA